MIRMRNRCRCLFVMALVLLGMATLPGRAGAQAGGSGVHWSAALGLGARPDYEGSDRLRAMLIGALRARWESGRYIELAGTESSGSAARIAGNVIADSQFEIGPVLQYRLPRGDVESNLVDAMKNVDGALEGGIFAEWHPKPWSVGITYAADMSHTHDGSLVELSGGYADELSPDFDLSVTLASTWASEDYNDTYFGVSGRDARPDRTDLAEYDADAGFKDVGGRVKLGYGPDNWGPWSIVGTLAYFRMIGDAADSPVVARAGDDNQFFYGLALMYRN